MQTGLRAVHRPRAYRRRLQRHRREEGRRCQPGLGSGEEIGQIRMQRIFSVRMLLGIPAAFATGFIIEYAFAHLVNRSALSLIVSTIAVYLCMIGVLLALLPADSKTQGPWRISGAWLQSLLLC